MDVVKPRPGVQQRQWRVILLDRCPFSRQLEGTVLRLHGFAVDECSTAAEAFRLLADKPYDALVLDPRFPDLDGLEFIRELRVWTSIGDLPIVAVTASALPGDREAVLAAGCDRYLAKPISTRQLAVQVAEVIAAEQRYGRTARRNRLTSTLVPQVAP